MSDSPNLPESERQRFVVVALVLIVGVVLYVLDWELIELVKDGASASLQRHVSILRAVVENLIAGAAAAILLAFIYRWAIAIIDPGDRVIEVEAGAITSRLLKNAKRTRSYIFIGNTATFVSAAVLPALVDSARSSGHPKSVILFLIDPTHQPALDSYVHFKDRVLRAESKIADEGLAMWVSPSGELKVETPEKVAAKVVAALYLAAFAALPSGMNVIVYLRPSFTPFRADVSDREVILTQESPSEAAVAFSSRGHFYGWYQKEADAMKGQAHVIDLSAMSDKLRLLGMVHPSSPRVELRQAIFALVAGISHLQSLAASPAILDMAVELVRRPRHAY